MPKLSKFYASFNNLPSIPKQIFKNCKSLNQIWLDENEIVDLDEDTFKGLSNLTIIHLSANRLTHIRSNTFANLSSLETLNLHANQIQIDNSSDIFRGLTNLKSLNLRKIEVLDLGSNIFKDLTSLKTISLATNPLKRIKAEYFEHNPNLEQLYLSYAKLEEIEDTLIDNMKNLTILNLNNNTCISKVYGDIGVQTPEILNATVREEIKNDLQINCKLKFIQKNNMIEQN
jgi:Leucine-rich repeat (LRR) protein